MSPQKYFLFIDRYDMEEGFFVDPPAEFLVELDNERYCPCCVRDAKKRKV